MKNKYKMSNAIQHQLYDMAKLLPAIPRMDAGGRPVYKPGTIDGQDLINSGQMDSKGQPGLPGVKYMSNVLTYRNNPKDLIEKFLEGGMDAVTTYVNQILEMQRAKEADLAEHIANQAGPYDHIIHFIEDRLTALDAEVITAGLRDTVIKECVAAEFAALLEFIKG